MRDCGAAVRTREIKALDADVVRVLNLDLVDELAQAVVVHRARAAEGHVARRHAREEPRGDLLLAFRLRGSERERNRAAERGAAGHGRDAPRGQARLRQGLGREGLDGPPHDKRCWEVLDHGEQRWRGGVRGAVALTVAGEGCVVNAQESEEAEEQERGDEEGGRGEGAGAGEAGKEATNDQR